MIDRRDVQRLSSILVAESIAELERLRMEIHLTKGALERSRVEIDATWRMLLELGQLYPHRSGSELNAVGTQDPIDRENC
jgi:hypothetical protein